MKLAIAALILGLMVVVVIVVFFLRYLRRRGRARDFRINDRLAWQKKWQELELMVDGHSSQLAVAVMEADKLFDRVMKSMALPGKDFGERLKFLCHSRPEVRAVWPAHLARNRLVHESYYELDKRAAVKALKLFACALKDLGVL